MIIAAAQLDRAPENHAQALAMLESVVAQARGADLLVLPELALCGYADPARIRRMAVPADSDFITRTRELARSARMGLIVGYAERAGDVLYNSALAIGPDGDLPGDTTVKSICGAIMNVSSFASGSDAPRPSCPGDRSKLSVC